MDVSWFCESCHIISSSGIDLNMLVARGCIFVVTNAGHLAWDPILKAGDETQKWKSRHPNLAMEGVLRLLDGFVM